MNSDRPRHAHGFTLVETIAVMSILAIIGSIASTLIYTGISSYRDASTLGQIHEEEATAMARLAVELRKIPLSSTAGVMAPQISSVTATSISWGANSSLALSGSQLRLVESGGAASILLDNVTGFAVQCYDESDAALAAALSGPQCYPIRRIKVSFTVSRQGISDTLRAKFFIRSTMQGGAA